MQAAPAAKPWAPYVEQLLSKQAEYSMLNGDFDHFQEDTAELLPEKEVHSLSHVAIMLTCIAYSMQYSTQLLANALHPAMTPSCRCYR